MNTKSKMAWLINPFYFIAGTRALIFGIVIMVLTALMAYFSNTWFDGVLDAHYGAPASFMGHLILLLAGLLSLWIVFLPMAKILSGSRIRLVDIAGTIALARFPLFVIAFTGFSNIIPKFNQYVAWMIGKQLQPVLFTGFEIVHIGFLFLIVFLMIVWMVSLLYNAYRLSANLKGSRAGISFVFGILIAEVISKLAVMSLIKNLPALFSI